MTTSAPRPRVLLLETIDDEAHRELAAVADITLASTPDPVATGDIAAGTSFDAVLTRGKGAATADLMDRCHGLRVIARCGVGLDNVDVDAATQRGIKVINLPACNARTMAEHTVMLMLAVSRGLLTYANAVAEDRWEARTEYDRDEVADKTLGIIGLGNIGRRVATIASALQMHVIYSDPSAAATTWTQVSLPELLSQSDFVSIHCPLNDSTRGLIDAAAIGTMKPGATIINTARAGILDHDALLAALQRGHLRGFGADVLDRTDPARVASLVQLPNVVVMPHVGSLTAATYRTICARAVRNVVALLSGTDPEPGVIFNDAALAAS